jgi:hypothetical protein
MSAYAIKFFHRERVSSYLHPPSSSAIVSAHSLSICSFIEARIEKRGISVNAGRSRNALAFAAGSFRKIGRFRRHFSTIGSFVLDSSEEVRCLTPCSPGARCASAEIIKLVSRAPVQQLLGRIV